MTHTSRIRTEHGGHKGSGRKTGFYGPRAEVKAVIKKLRRKNGKAEADAQLER